MRRRVLLALALLVALAALVAGAWLGPRLIEDPGYVLIEFGPWRVQMTAVVLVLALLAAWLAGSLLVALIRLPSRAARRVREARHRRSLDRGLLALSEGDWKQAERLLGRAMSGPNVGTAGYLAAARAAQGQADPERRDLYLEQAARPGGRRALATGLLRARMLVEDKQFNAAVEVLEALHLKHARHQGVLKLLLECYQQADRWHDVRLLMPALRRAGVFGKVRADELEALAAAREFEAATDRPRLEAIWQGLPRALTRHPDVVAAFAARALELDHAALAEPALRHALAQQPDDRLFALYAESDPDDRPARIRQCEKWLSQYDRAALRLALGRLYLDARQDDKAREHLEAAVGHSADPRAYALLGRLLDRAGDLESATRCYRNALRMEQGRAPEPLPGPASPGS
ncbi:MAG: heme biosynthesis HemY N-terminal domain-containing protein [Wenzhouxiangellaceae bacterium]|nr:heme biosynthesis HemY N-terminal domain-containing protein [Wenzhouxiangellaceae bacterium]